MEAKNTLAEIKVIEHELKAEKGQLAKQYLEGQLYLLKKLYRNNVDLPKDARSNYKY